MLQENIKIVIKKNKKIWFISKYCRLPSEKIHYEDVFQVKGSYPARGFSILRCLAIQGYDCTLFVARHDYKLFSFSYSPSNEVRYIDGVRVVIINIIPYKKVQSLARVFGWIQFEIKLFLLNKKDLPRPDHIIASSLSLLSIINGIFFRLRFRSSLVFEIRDIWPLVLTENGKFSNFNPFVLGLKFIEWIGYKYSDHIVATMPNLSEHVENVLGYKKNVSCIPLGISEELMTQTPIPLTEDILRSLPENKFIVTYVGSIGIDNALDTFFEVARMFKDSNKVVFRIFGRGDLLQEYKSRCSDLSNVVFNGFIPNPMVQSVLEKSSILYFATHPTIVLKYGQSLNKIIDYMYAAKPIIASHSGYKSMINEARCGYFVPAGDKETLYSEVVRLSDLSKEQLRVIGLRGKEWILKNRQYSILARNYASLLEERVF